MKQLFDTVSHEMSTLTTKRYSTSFSLGIKMLNIELQQPIYSIYGFVRFGMKLLIHFMGMTKRGCWMIFVNKRTKQSRTEYL